MARKGDVIENPVTGERIEFLETARDTNGELLRLDWALSKRGFVAAEHVHPRQEERFHVLAGTLTGRINGQKRRFRAGDMIVVPPGVRHAWWNDSDEEMRATIEFRPALRTETLFEQFFGLARDGKVSKRGWPSPFQIAVTAPLYLDEARPPWLPLRVLRALLAPIAAIGRRLGYQAYHPEYETTREERAA